MAETDTTPRTPGLEELDALIRRHCDCRSPQQAGTRSGYVCPEHRILCGLTTERDALRQTLDSIALYGSDTLSGRADGGAEDRAWFRAGIIEMVNRARRALNPEGADDAD